MEKSGGVSPARRAGFAAQHRAEPALSGRKLICNAALQARSEDRGNPIFRLQGGEYGAVSPLLSVCGVTRLCLIEAQRRADASSLLFMCCEKDRHPQRTKPLGGSGRCATRAWPGIGSPKQSNEALKGQELRWRPLTERDRSLVPDFMRWAASGPQTALGDESHIIPEG